MFRTFCFSVCVSMSLPPSVCCNNCAHGQDMLDLCGRINGTACLGTVGQGRAAAPRQRGQPGAIDVFYVSA